jgi:hypothetical protein
MKVLTPDRTPSIHAAMLIPVLQECVLRCVFPLGGFMDGILEPLVAIQNRR